MNKKLHAKMYPSRAPIPIQYHLASGNISRNLRNCTPNESEDPGGTCAAETYMLLKIHPPNFSLFSFHFLPKVEIFKMLT